MSIGRSLFIVALGSAIVLTWDRGPDFEIRERSRIQAHFDSVLSELHARDVSALSPVVRARRSGLIAELEAYRDRGVFPHNYDMPGLVPSFIDPRTGVRCAVGHLVEWSGRGDIVLRVARADNHVLVMQLAGDTSFRRWLDRDGITLAEAARIQVPYLKAPDPAPERGDAVGNTRPGNVAAVALSAGAVGLTAWNLLRNRHSERRAVAVAGIATGLAGAVLGNVMLGGGQAIPVRAKTAIWTGLASTLSGALAAVPIFGTGTDQVEISPTVTPEGKGSSRLGISAGIRF